MTSPIVATATHSPSLLQPAVFTMAPRVQHAPRENAPVERVATEADYAGLCRQSNINIDLLDRLRELPSYQRYGVYKYNAALRTALGVKGESTFKKVVHKAFGGIFRNNTATSSAQLLGRLEANRFNTELARFVVNTRKEHRQERGLEKILKSMTSANTGAMRSRGALSVMEVLLKHENMKEMDADAKSKTKKMLCDLLKGENGTIQLTESECAEMLCIAYASVHPADKALLRSIRHAVQSRPDDFRGKMLAVMLEAASDDGYDKASKELAFRMAMSDKLQHTNGNSNRQALIAYLCKEPRPQLTKAASEAIAKRLVKQLDPNKTRNNTQANIVKFVFPVAIGMENRSLLLDLLTKVDKENLMNVIQDLPSKLPADASDAIAQFLLPAATDMDDIAAARNLVCALVERADSGTLLAFVSRVPPPPLSEDVKLAIARRLVIVSSPESDHSELKNIAHFVLRFAGDTTDQNEGGRLMRNLLVTMNDTVLLSYLDANPSLPREANKIIAQELNTRVNAMPEDQQVAAAKFVFTVAMGMEDMGATREMIGVLTSRMNSAPLLKYLTQRTHALLPEIMNREIAEQLTGKLGGADFDKQLAITEFALPVALKMDDAVVAKKLARDLVDRIDKDILPAYLNQEPSPQLTDAERLRLAQTLMANIDSAKDEDKGTLMTSFLRVVARMKDASAAGKLATDLTDKFVPPDTSKPGKVITEALIGMPVAERLELAARLQKSMGKTPPIALAEGLARTWWKTCKENAITAHEGAGRLARLLSDMDCKDFKAWTAVFNVADRLMERLDEDMRDLLRHPGNESTKEKIEQIKTAKRSIIEAVTNEKMEQLKEQIIPISALTEPNTATHINARNQRIALTQRGIADWLVKHDNLLRTCAELRLPALGAEITAALQRQANRWTSEWTSTTKRPGNFDTTPQNLTFTEKLASSDLVSHLSLAPVRSLGTGSFGSTWLYETSSPALPKLVIKFPHVGDTLSPDQKEFCEITLDGDFKAYKALHPGRNRDDSRICWSYGMARLKHPETGQPCKALVLEALDGVDLFHLKEELAFEASNRHLLTEYPAIFSLLTRTMGEACAELAAAGYAHSDLKPENVIVLSDGSMKVIDLGIAVPIGTQLGSRHGTPLYGAREKIEGVQFWTDRPPAIFVHATSDVYEGGATAFYTSEMIQKRGIGNMRANPLSISKGTVRHTDENGNTYRRNGDFLQVTADLSSEASTSPVGAYERYFSGVLQDDPAMRPTLKQALQEPYVTDPLEVERAQAALMRAVDQFRRRLDNAQTSAPPYVVSPLHSATVPEKLEEPRYDDAGTLIPEAELFTRWFASTPGIAIPEAVYRLDEAARGGHGIAQTNPVHALSQFDFALQTLCSRIGKKEDTERLDFIINSVYDNWCKIPVPRSMQAPGANAGQIRDAVLKIENTVTDMLTQHGHDPRALPVIESGRRILAIAYWFAHVQNRLTPKNGYQELEDGVRRANGNCDSVIAALKSKLDGIREEIGAKYGAPPDVLKSQHPVGAIAAKLTPIDRSVKQALPFLPAPPPIPEAKSRALPPPPIPPRSRSTGPSGSTALPNTKSGLKSHYDERFGRAWLGWKNTAEVRTTRSVSNSKRQVLDIDAEARALEEASRYGGLGISLSSEEIATLKQHRGAIDQTRLALLDDLEKHWGTSNPQKQAKGYPKGVGVIADATLARIEKDMRSWLANLERLNLVLKTIDAEEAKTTRKQKEIDAASEEPSRKDLFKNAEESSVGTFLKKHQKTSSATYYVLQAKGKTTYSDTKVPGSISRNRFRMVETNDMPLEANGRDEGAHVMDDDGNVTRTTKGRWAVFNDPKKDGGQG